MSITYRKFKKLLLLVMSLVIFGSSSFASNTLSHLHKEQINLQPEPGFFRFNFDTVSMPKPIETMGLLGINYFADLTPWIYGGVGAYGAVTGTQGGLFTLGIGGGYHQHFSDRFWGDIGIYAGGGGGKSSLVGGGLMLRPYAGIAYDFRFARVGLHYSYINFPSGKIHSQQIGLDLDFPYDFYYVSTQENKSGLFHVDDVHLLDELLFNLQRNDFAILLQAYRQQAGVHNINRVVQDGTIGLVGAELDHYLTDRCFWWVKADGAFSGIPNGYMDILGGVGYHANLISRLALVPQLGIGAGGGGNVDTGGGIIIQPELGIEWPWSNNFASRLSGGYLWAPKGQLRAYTAMAALIYHLDLAQGGQSRQSADSINYSYGLQHWRIQIFNQTYLHPQRAHTSITSAINLIVVQFDQLITPHLFFSYQAASAYSGYHAGGLATGMIGPGIQTSEWLDHLRLYSELLIGAGGGGGLALGGGAIIEPLIGLHYQLNKTFGLQASVSEIKALRHDLHTPVVNIGIDINFATLNRDS